MTQLTRAVRDILKGDTDGRWYEFRAWNQQSRLGFGTAEEADAYCEHLNAKRDTGHYHAYPIEDRRTLLSLEGGRDTDGFEIAVALQVIRDATEQGQ